MKGMMMLACACAAAAMLSAPVGAQETAAPGKDSTQKETQKREARRLPCDAGNLVIGFGDLAVYRTGGGDTHDGLQSAAVNPLSAMTAEFFVARGFSLGLIGTFQYLEEKQVVAIIGIPQQVTVEVTAFGGGLILSYYYAVTDRFLPFVSLLATYGKGIYKASPLYDGKSYVLDIGISCGFNYMISGDLGVFIAVTHIRDRVDSGGAVNWGYTTGFGLGFRLFL